MEWEGDDLNNAQVSFWANTASVDSNSVDRDTHLRSGEFFDREKFEKLSFKSIAITGSGDSWKRAGELSIKDVTKPVPLDAEWSGMAKDPMAIPRPVWSDKYRTCVARSTARNSA